MEAITLDDAMAAYEEDNYEVSFPLLVQLSKQSKDPEVTYMLGVHYHNGMGVAKDRQKAIELWRKASKNGCVDAQYALLEITQTTSQCCKG